MTGRVRSMLILAVFCSLLMIALYLGGLFEGIEHKSLDWRFRLTANPADADSAVVLVAIDEQSLQAFKQNGIVWKWPRDLYAILLRYLQRGGARVVVFDILFSDADIDRLSSDAEQTDGAFTSAQQSAGNVALAAHLRSEENFLAPDNELVFDAFAQKQFAPPHAAAFFENYDFAILPLPLFQSSAAAIGAANYRDDPHDGICRRLDLFFTYKGQLFPHLGTAAFILDQGVQNIRIEPGKRVLFDQLAVPLGRDNRYLIKWYGKGGVDGPFRYYSIGPLITSAIAEEQGSLPIVPSNLFRDKVVIVGANATGLFDFHNTPFTQEEPYPAMEIYATQISNLRQGDFLHRIGRLWIVVAIGLLSSLICSAFFYIPQVSRVVLLAIGLAVGWMVLAFFLFSAANLWIDWVAPESSIIFSFAATALVSYETEGRARRRLRSMFGRYLSPVVIAEVVEKNDALELGGRELDCTIFFSDIKSFSTISEQMSPHELVTWLNEYFTVATDIILKYDGLLDKYIGDAVMAVFGAPLAKPDHALLACHAALDIQQAIQEKFLNNDGKPSFETRIGLNSGHVVVGNIGSSLRFDYTAIGDDVNLASRLEGVNKIFSTRILISEFTRMRLDDSLVCRELDLLRVKGKQKAVKVYELVGKKETVDAERMAFIQEFDRALHLYRQRDFATALKSFVELTRRMPDDGAAREYQHRCEEFCTTPPPGDWDGVYTMKTK